MLSTNSPTFPITLVLCAVLACSAAYGQDDAESFRKDRLKIEALMRLSNVDVNRDEKLLATVTRYLEHLGSDPQQLRIVRQLKPKGIGSRLLDLASHWDEQGLTTEALQAVEYTLSRDGQETLWNRLSTDAPDENTLRLAKILALSDTREAYALADALLGQPEISPPVRQHAAMSMAKFPEGQAKLLAMAEEDRLSPETRFLIGPLMRSSTLSEIREKAAVLFPPKKSASVELPSIEELCRKRGEVARGKLLFEGVATCSQCHIVSGVGKNVGPDLSEIGSKLSREAMYLAILEPSAGISHNYETYAALLDSGAVVVGLLVSRTETAMVLKDAQGIERTLDVDSIEELKKLEKSLMPDNLQETMSPEGLVDLVEYLMTLQKPPVHASTSP